jgi:hypothetical protein
MYKHFYLIMFLMMLILILARKFLLFISGEFELFVKKGLYNDR